MCALHGGIYALRTSVTKLLASKDPDTGAWRAAGVVTHRGEVVRASAVISSCDHFLQDKSSTEGSEEASEQTGVRADEGMACKRMIVFTDRSLLGDEGVNLCVVPLGATEPALANVVQVLQLDWATGACPRGYHVLHLSQAMRVSQGTSDAEVSFDDLERVLKSLLSHCVADGAGPNCCLYRCSYIHQPRALDRRWTRGTPAGHILDACAAGRSLVLAADPSAVPQLLVGREVVEARSMFLDLPIYGSAEVPTGDDFLRKPAHVAMEEKSSAMEDLEHFNEQMQGASGDAQVSAAAASLDTHISGNDADAADASVCADGKVAAPE